MTTEMKKVLSAIIALFLCLELCPQTRVQYFRHFDTEDGLVNNSVSSIAEDKYGFIWFGTKNGICRFDGQNFVSFGESEVVVGSCSDSNGNIWYSTSSGLYRINIDMGKVELFSTLLDRPYHACFSLVGGLDSSIWLIQDARIVRLDYGKLSSSNYAIGDGAVPSRLCLDNGGVPCVTASDGIIYRYDADEDCFLPYASILGKEEIADGKSLVYITCSHSNVLTVSTSSNDIISFNPESRKVELVFRGNQDGRDAQVRCLDARQENALQVGTDKGLYVFHDDGSYKLYVNNPLDKYSLSNDNLRCMMGDSNGRYWYGTYYSGINMFEKTEFRFFSDLADNGDEALHGCTVRSMCQDRIGNLWVCTEDGFLNVVSPDGKVSYFTPEQGVPKSNFHAAVYADGKVFVASYDNGIFVFDAQVRCLEHHVAIESGHAVVMKHLVDGRIAIGTTKGLYLMDRGYDEVHVLSGTDGLFVHSLCQISPSVLLLGTYSAGLFKYDLDTGKNERVVINVDQGIFPNYITDIFIDVESRIYLATEGAGLFRIDKLEGTQCSATRFSIDDGLPSNIIGAVCQSKDGRIWVSSDPGIAYIRKDDKIEVLVDNDTPVGQSFRYGSVLHAPDDRIYMGSTRGIIAFYPSDFVHNDKYTLYCTEIIAGGRNGEQSVLGEDGNCFAGTKFKVRQSDVSYLTFKFAAPSADSYKKVKYRYSFSKRGLRYESVAEENYVTFAGVGPGKYTFRVSIEGMEGERFSRQMELRVVPPFYRSTFAWIIYITVLASVSWLYVRQKLNRRRKDREQLLKNLEEEKQKEIYDAKINFFTNIAHDIRTPLTLIKMPIDKIVEKKEYLESTKDDIRLVKANTDKLLDLINQLLDFRKVESKQLRLNFLSEDICVLVRKCYNLFIQAATARGIEYDCFCPQEKIIIKCASASVEKIVSNMLSNAFKYCESRVVLTLKRSEDGGSIMISVRSDGDRIAPENRERIFEPFYQEKRRSHPVVNKSYGLGLPFSRSLAELHNGSLVYDADDLEMNCFVLTLPVNQPNQIQLPNEMCNETAADMNHDLMADRHNLLIVEDNAEMSSYLKKELSNEYNVITAVNGLEALEVLKRERVDLIVSDIMMPEMDGCALCDYIKTNIEYSHIPVILLTAGVGMESHIESFQVGADGYLEKPFSVELLRANITNIFKNRELSNKLYATSPLSHFTGHKANNMDIDFMARINEEIMLRISDSELSVDDLAAAMLMSKSTLFRKVKANTNLNINEYIRLVRLKKAAELLSEGKYRINEVAYLVGFSSPSYFANKFQQQFNLSPSEFLRKLRR